MPESALGQLLPKPMPGIMPSLFSAPVAPVSARVKVALPELQTPESRPRVVPLGALSAIACAFSWEVLRLLKVTEMPVTVSALGSSAAVTVRVELAETPTPLLEPVMLMGFDPPTVICADERSPRGSSKTLTARTNGLKLRRENWIGRWGKGEENMASKPHVVVPTACCS